jgi:general secretion pathway protein F
MEFQYRCIDAMGRSINGDITAEGVAEAKSLLKGKGFTVLELRPKAKDAGIPLLKRFSIKRVKDDEIYSLFRELSILLRSGIKIDRAMEVLIGSTANPHLRAALSEILSDVKAGRPISEAFSRTGLFSLLAITMIRAGEGVGDIRSAFENIADYQRFQIQFKGEIKNALAYPTFLISASLLTILVIFKFIIPRFFSIFGQNEATLPLMAKLLYSIANFLSLSNMYLLLTALLVVALMAKVLNMRRIVSGLFTNLTYIPLVGRLILYLELSRFSYSMYSMLNSGIEFIKALDLSTGVIMDRRIRASIEPTILQIREGRGIADVFSTVSVLPDMVHNMIRIGEESGNLKEIFFEIHKVFDEKFKNTTKRILSLVEPIVITITGIIVGFIVISLILTVMSAGNIKL